MPSSGLWDLVMDMDWDGVIQHAKDHPEDASYVDGHYYESVLYLACQHNPPVAAIHAILQAYPKAVLHVSRAHHDLPLHIAVRYQLGTEILEELLTDFPVTAVEQTRFGRTPLMALWEFRHKSRRQEQERTEQGQSEANQQDTNETEEDEQFWDKVMVILRAVARFREDPKYFAQKPSTRTKEFRCHASESSDRSSHQESVDNNEKRSDVNPLVVHAAVSLGAQSCPVEVLEYVLARFPDQVSTRDRWGYLPLHIAVRSPPWNGSASMKHKHRSREQRFVASLLQAYPEAATIPHSRGSTDKAEHAAIDNRLPLITALNNGHTWNGTVQDLFRTAPEVLQVRDPVSGLLPFHLAAAGDSANDLDTVFEVLRAHPQLMALMNREDDWESLGSATENPPEPVASKPSIFMVAEIPLLGTAAAALIGT